MNRFYSSVSCWTVAASVMIHHPVRAADPPTPPVQRADTVNLPYWGTVTAVTKTAITIQAPNTDLAPVELLLSDDLASGKVPVRGRLVPGQVRSYSVSPAGMYRITDVKVGDHVIVHYAHIAGRNICDHICIRKRPGGRVPPLPEEAEALMRPPPAPPGFNAPRYIAYHELMNAHWDLVDHRIPYPEYFGSRRKFPSLLPLAPPPREVHPLRATP